MQLENKTLALAAELISHPSVTPNDAGVQDILIKRLERLGFGVFSREVQGVKSFWAAIGRKSPVLAFAGHSDVVPPGDETLWTSPPFSPTVRDCKLYGRGAADMKGGLAACITAIEEFLKPQKSELYFTLGLLIAGDEEADISHGTSDMLQWLAEQGKRVDYCIVCEPSSVNRLGDTIKVGRRGSYTGKLRIKGVQGHAAYPERAKNALQMALEPLFELTKLAWDKGSGDVSPTTFQITNLSAGTGATNVIPGTCDVVFNFRFPPAVTPEHLRERCEEALRRHSLDFEIEWILGAKPFRTKAGKLVEVVSSCIEEQLGLTPQHSTSGGTSDARYFAQAGAEVVEVGALNESIHEVDEHVDTSDLTALSALYAAILQRFANIIKGNS